VDENGRPQRLSSVLPDSIMHWMRSA